MTECILNLLDPSTAGGVIIIFIDLVSTNILLAMLGFPLSQKKHADVCFKPSRLFFNFSMNKLITVELHLLPIATSPF